MHRPSSSKATACLPEDEPQRKQLSRLLLQQEKTKAASPESATQSTFKIDWPGYNNKDHCQRDLTSPPKYVSRFASRSTCSSRESSMQGPLTPELTASIERVPSMIREELSQRLPCFSSVRKSSTFGPSADHFMSGIEGVHSNQENSTVSSTTERAVLAPVSSIVEATFFENNEPVPLRPVAYVPNSRAARYMGLESPIEPATPQSALPSYRADAHPSLNISTRPLLSSEQNGLPVEKSELSKYTLPASVEPKPAQEGPYRMAVAKSTCE